MRSLRLFCAVTAVSLSFSHYVMAEELAIEYVPAASSDQQVGQDEAPTVEEPSPITLVEHCGDQESCTGCADCAACTPICSLFTPREPGLILGAELLVLRANVRNPGLSDTDGGVPPIPPGPGPFPPLWVMNQVVPLELPWEAGFRGQVGYRFDSGWETVFQYTYYQSEEEQVQFLGGGMGGAFAAGRLGVEQNIFDFEAGRWFSTSPSHDIRLFGGLRWANLDTEFIRGTNFPLAQIEAYRTEMDGFGVRAGGESHWVIGGGFSGFVRGAGSVLIGDFDNQSFSIQDLGPLVLVTNREESTRQGVPILEAAVGVNYRRGKFEVQAGYELAHWFNALPLPANDSFSSIDITFDGLFARAGWNY